MASFSVRKNSIKKDPLFTENANTKYVLIWIGVFFLLGFWIDKDMVCPESRMKERLIAAFFVGVVFVFLRIWKYRKYYKSVFTSFLEIVIGLIGFAGVIFVLSMALKVPENIVYHLCAKNKKIKVNCDISGFEKTSGKNLDAIIYKYNGKEYRWLLSKTQRKSNSELDYISNYKVRLVGRPSIAGVMIVKERKLISTFH